MTDVERGKEKLKEGLLHACESEFEGLPLDENAPVEFSEKLEADMDHLLRAEKRPLWRLTNTCGKRVALVVAAVLLLCGLLAGCRPIRETIDRFFVRKSEDYYEVHPFTPSEAPMRIVSRKQLTEVPSGFQPFSERVGTFDCRTVWKNEAGSFITFCQFAIRTQVWIGRCETNIEYFEVDGVEILCAVRQENGARACYWQDGEYAYCLDVPVFASREEVERMIRSVR